MSSSNPKVRAARLAGYVAVVVTTLATSLAGLVAWAPEAHAIGTNSACGPGVELHNCPPLCSKLLTAVQVSKVFHVHLGKADWHTDGSPEDTCTYAEVSDHSSTVTDTVDAHQGVADFAQQVSIDKQFNRNAKVQKVPALGAHAVEIVSCMGTGSSAYCYPNYVVLSKGHLVQAAEALDTVNMATMQKRYAPEIQAWVKELLAKA